MFNLDRVRRPLLGALCFAGAGRVLAAAPVAAAAMPTPFTSLLTVVLGLGVVLAMIVAVAWLFKRLSGGVLGISNRLRVVGGTMVGQKERVVIVELEGEWLVLGVTPQQVNLLHKMSRPASADAEPPAATEPFARWMKAALDKSRQVGKRNEP